MKCEACKYEHNDFDSNIPFRNVKSIMGENFCVDGYDDGVYYSEVRVKLYACPKCGTIKISE
jgi:hypothetical protein